MTSYVDMKFDMSPGDIVAAARALGNLKETEGWRVLMAILDKTERDLEKRGVRDYQNGPVYIGALELIEAIRDLPDKWVHIARRLQEEQEEQTTEDVLGIKLGEGTVSI